MIQRLRRKFIIINMSLVATVLLIVLAPLALGALRQARITEGDVLLAALDRRMDDIPPMGPEISKHFEPDGGRRGNTASPLPTFCVQLDETGAIETFTLQNATVSDEVMADVAAQALAAGNNAGTLKEYNLRYLIRFSSEGAKIAFVDLSSSRTDVTRQLIRLLIAGVAGLGLFFLISLGLSNWALRPVAQSWEQQRQFVADASHALKTPLTAILANIDVVLSHPKETVAEQARWLNSIKTESLRMKELVDDMLFLARADLSASPTMELFSLTDAVRSAAQPFEAVALEAGVRLNTDIAESVALYGNRKQMERLTAILLDNAVTYAGNGGTVLVQLTADACNVRLCVHNTGAPIAQENLPHLFERFYRGDAARVRSDGGCGLGLAIAKSIAQTHRASIVVTSNSVSGTAFLVDWRDRRALAG